MYCECIIITIKAINNKMYLVLQKPHLTEKTFQPLIVKYFSQTFSLIVRKRTLGKWDKKLGT